MPNLAPRVKLYTKDYPIFEEYGVQPEIDKALKSKVWLKSGGSIVINQTPTICYEILSEVKKIGPELNGHGVVLRVNPEIARALKEEEKAVLADLRNALGREITLKPDTHLHHEQFDVMAT